MSVSKPCTEYGSYHCGLFCENFIVTNGPPPQKNFSYYFWMFIYVFTSDPAESSTYLFFQYPLKYHQSMLRPLKWPFPLRPSNENYLSPKSPILIIHLIMSNQNIHCSLRSVSWLYRLAVIILSCHSRIMNSVGANFCFIRISNIAQFFNISLLFRIFP